MPYGGIDNLREDIKDIHLKIIICALRAGTPDNKFLLNKKSMSRKVRMVRKDRVKEFGRNKKAYKYV